MCRFSIRSRSRVTRRIRIRIRTRVFIITSISIVISLSVRYSLSLSRIVCGSNRIITNARVRARIRSCIIGSASRLLQYFYVGDIVRW